MRRESCRLNYDEIVKGLRTCMAANSSCEDCPYDDPADILCECANRVSKDAADAIEYLQTENAALQRQIDNLTRAQAALVKEYDKKLEELASYKETGLEPEEIKELCTDDVAEVAKMFRKMIESGEINHLQDLLQAEQDGRLVVLPCKVGDSVYIPDLEKKIPVKERVQGISISVSGRTILHFGGYPVVCAWGDGCGKDWFLIREEAEAALAGKGGDG